MLHPPLSYGYDENDFILILSSNKTGGAPGNTDAPPAFCRGAAALTKTEDDRPIK